MDHSTYITEQLKNNKKITFRTLALEREININEAKSALAEYIISLSENEKDNTRIIYCVTDYNNNKLDPSKVPEYSIRLLTQSEYELSKSSFTADYKQFIYSIAPKDASNSLTVENTPLSVEQMSKIGYLVFPSLDKIDRYPQQQTTIEVKEKNSIVPKTEGKEKIIVKAKVEPKTIAIKPKFEVKENNSAKPKESFFKSNAGAKMALSKPEDSVLLKYKDEVSVKPKKSSTANFFAVKQPKFGSPKVKKDVEVTAAAIVNSPAINKVSPALKPTETKKGAKATPATKSLLSKSGQRAKVSRQIIVSSTEESEDDSDAFQSDSTKLEAEMFADDLESESESALTIASPTSKKLKDKSDAFLNDNLKNEPLDEAQKVVSDPLPKKPATLSLESWAQASVQSPVIKEEPLNAVPKASATGKSKKLVFKRKDLEANLKLKEDGPSPKKQKPEFEDTKPTEAPPKIQPTNATSAKQSNISSFFRPKS